MSSTRTDLEGLMPTAVADRVIESVTQQSVVLQFARTERMPTGVEQVPVVSTAPSADWVAAGSRKPVTEIEWSAATLRAEELAAVTAVPDVYITDATWDVESSVESELAAAIARRLDAAVLFGIDAPASFPTGGILGLAGTPVTGDDALAALSAALDRLEGDGLVPDGIAASTAIGSALRAAYREAGIVPGQAPASEVYGLPVRVTAPWQSTTADAVVGGWQYLLIGIREDVNFAQSRDGVLVDDDGVVKVSAFQDDQTLVRVYARFGCAVAKPVGADGSPADPFVAAKWTNGSTRAAPAARAKSS